MGIETRGEMSLIEDQGPMGLERQEHDEVSPEESDNAADDALLATTSKEQMQAMDDEQLAAFFDAFKTDAGREQAMAILEAKDGKEVDAMMATFKGKPVDL